MIYQGNALKSQNKLNTYRLAIKYLPLVIGATIALTTCVKHHEPQPAVHAKGECNKCHTKIAYVAYFEKKGNPTPQQMAEAVLATKNPRLMAAIATAGEKNTPFWIRNGGYKKRHVGAWQMSKANHKAYGKTPYDPVGQSIQAERLLVDLTNESHDIQKALNAYGGDKKGRYGRVVLAELSNVP